MDRKRNSASADTPWNRASALFVPVARTSARRAGLKSCPTAAPLGRHTVEQGFSPVRVPGPGASGRAPAVLRTPVPKRIVRHVTGKTCEGAGHTSRRSASRGPSSFNSLGRFCMVAGPRRRKTALRCLGLALAVLVLLIPRSGAAQVLYGSVVGDVVDSTGAALPGANVVITNNGTGLTRETVTDAVGPLQRPERPGGRVHVEGQPERLQDVRTDAGHGHHQQRHAPGCHARDRRDGRDRDRQVGASEAADRHGGGAQQPGGGGDGEPPGTARAATTSRSTGCFRASRLPSTRTPYRPTRLDRSSSR